MSDIESESLLAVKSLRLKFEQLAVDSPRQNKSLEPPLSPRPRSQSSGNTALAPTQSPHQPLRNVSSNSDLKGTKRPPPPPPSSSHNRSRTSSPSPTPSAQTDVNSSPPLPPPLLRPVPTPIVSSRVGSYGASTVFGSTEELNNIEGIPTSSSVSSLRHKFMNKPSPPKPNGIRDTDDHHLPKPTIPPRKPSKTVSSDSLIPIDASSEENIFDPPPYSHSKSSSSYSNSSSSSSINLLDDSSEEETDITVDEADLSSASTTTLPPALPARKPRVSDGMSASTTSLNLSHRPPPPRPPPRHRPTPDSLPEIITHKPPSPPPLPARRGTVEIGVPLTVSVPPPRHPSASNSVTSLHQPPPSQPPSQPPTPSLYHHHHHHRILSAPNVSSGIENIYTTSPIATTPTITTPNERKTFGKLPPPPTRTIAPGDKLPPARRAQTPSSDEDDESEDEGDVKGTGVDMLPDSSRSSRRPPHLLQTFASLAHGHTAGTENRIQVPAHTGYLVMANGRVVVGHSHHLRVWDIVRSVDVPVLDLDLRILGRDSKVSVTVTALEVRSFAGGSLVWVGTKEGHLIEVNVVTGELTGCKFSAHMHAVLHLFRYGGAMVSVDDSGKVLIFGSHDEPTTDLLKTTPRVMRITDKLDFAKIIGCGFLWTAGRSEVHCAGTPQRVPIIRVYDLFPVPGTSGSGFCSTSPGAAPSRTGQGKTILPIEHVGPVTSASVVPTNPGILYVGHEEGFISIWDLGGESGMERELPRCVEVMKVSASDVLSVEGVNDRLWVGSRNGMISAYDVVPRPWLLTNCWSAHPGLPVRQMTVDVWGFVDGKRRLGVVSVGRDERVGLWDGLLTNDWMEKELMKHEREFSTYRELKLLIVSWNCDSARPDSLTGSRDNVNFLHDVLTSLDGKGGPDIIVFGLQEVIDLESRKMAAKNVILGGGHGMKKSKGLTVGVVSSSSSSSGASVDETVLLGLSDKVTGAYKRWYDALVLAVRLAMPPDCPYSVVHTESLVGLFSCIFVKHSERGALKDLAITTVKRGMGGRYGNKGGIISRFVIEDSSLCFVNCHLAAGQHALRSRNADVAGMLEETLFPTTLEPQAFVGGGDGSMVLDHETVFVNGDMNYRIDQRRDAIVAAVKAGEHETMHAHDQLLKEIKYNRGCRFRTFSEGPLTFPPTYKYDRRSNEYDTSEKRRAPAWCDRVLWRASKGRVEQFHYKRWEVDVSDHRPISAAFRVTVKNVRQELRYRVKQEVEIMWADEEVRVLKGLEEFYTRTLMVV
ncbi:DNase I-like protein [Marasmius fiardii PR-910]|nr:DNase I-like protein [Marasmius fiardii PR-910]